MAVGYRGSNGTTHREWSDGRWFTGSNWTVLAMVDGRAVLPLLQQTLLASTAGTAAMLPRSGSAFSSDQGLGERSGEMRRLGHASCKSRALERALGMPTKRSAECQGVLEGLGFAAN